MSKENMSILNDFANSHTLARDIKVVITPYHKSFKPRSANIPARYEDANMLSSIITGAEIFLNYLNREGYILVRKKVKK